MTRQKLQKQLERVLTDLDRVAGVLEKAGFDTQRDLLDLAADRVEDVQESLSAL